MAQDSTDGVYSVSLYTGPDQHYYALDTAACEFTIKDSAGHIWTPGDEQYDLNNVPDSTILRILVKIKDDVNAYFWPFPNPAVTVGANDVSWGRIRRGSGDPGSIQWDSWEYQNANPSATPLKEVEIFSDAVQDHIQYGVRICWDDPHQEAIYYDLTPVDTIDGNKGGVEFEGDNHGSSAGDAIRVKPTDSDIIQGLQGADITFKIFPVDHYHIKRFIVDSAESNVVSAKNNPDDPSYSAYDKTSELIPRTEQFGRSYKAYEWENIQGPLYYWVEFEVDEEVEDEFVAMTPVVQFDSSICEIVFNTALSEDSIKIEGVDMVKVGANMDVHLYILNEYGLVDNTFWLGTDPDNLNPIVLSNGLPVQGESKNLYIIPYGVVSQPLYYRIVIEGVTPGPSPDPSQSDSWEDRENEIVQKIVAQHSDTMGYKESTVKTAKIFAKDLISKLKQGGTTLSESKRKYAIARDTLSAQIAKLGFKKSAVDTTLLTATRVIKNTQDH